MNVFDYFFRRSSRQEQQQQRREMERFMSAIENLTAAVVGLTATIDTVVAEWQKPTPGEPEIQAAADAVANQTKRLQDMMTPPTP